jgi:hypothetical protein
MDSIHKKYATPLFLHRKCLQVGTKKSGLLKKEKFWQLENIIIQQINVIAFAE